MRRILLSAAAGVLLVALIAAFAPDRGRTKFAADPGPLQTVIGMPTESPSPSVSPTPSATPTVAPTTAAPTKSTSPKPAKPPACETPGKNQLEVEQALAKLGGYGAISVDGVQDPTDCATIKNFQTRFGLKPVDGIAGPATAFVANRLANTDTSACGAGAGVVACIDLTHQTTWIMKDGALAYGPTVTRTGMNGYATPEGTYKIGDRALKSFSTDYHVWLPYWQRIVRGIGFHETTTYIHDGSIGSHGCVNLLHTDALAYWDTLKTGNTVKVFGRRPGT